MEKREQEYKNMLAEMDNPAPELEHVVTHARAKARKTQNIRRFLITPACGFIAVLMAFTAMVNLFPTVAMAVERIPGLRELAVAVSFSPSLKTAVDNEYVQSINQEQTDNGITMRVEYVIVDQKQLNIFYTLQSQKYAQLNVTPEIRGLDGQALESYSIAAIYKDGFGLYSQGDGKRKPLKNEALRQFTVDFIQGDMPEGIIFIGRVNDSAPAKSDMQAAPEASAGTALHSVFNFEPVIVAEFTFTLQFDPAYTHTGETIYVNQDIVLDGQRFTVTTAEIYPTHMRVNVAADETNTAWLQSLEFFFLNEKGERFDTISNGIRATGTGDSPEMTSHYLESSFFHQSDHLTMYITEAGWLDKDMETVRVDLSDTSSDKMPEGVTFTKAERIGNSWELTFSAAERKPNASYQLFGIRYYDENGGEYEYNSWASGMTGLYDEKTGEYVETPGLFWVQFALLDYPHDIVYLSPSYSRVTAFETPTAVTIK
jgi:hypothetical protein